MHLLLTQKGSLNEGDDAVDLGQTPGEVIILSAADTEIASLSAAYGEYICDRSSFTLRLANLMQLTHPMSIDVYCNDIIARAKLVIVRALGGESYWPYGLEKLHALAHENGIILIVLPGDTNRDLGLARFCTVDPEICNQIFQYFIEGGPDNMKLCLSYCDHLMGTGEKPNLAVPLLKAGIWWPGEGICDLKTIQKYSVKNAPVVAINFYRALVQSGGLQPIEALIGALRARELNVLPIFISSLKDNVSVETLRGIFKKVPPDIVINTTGFAASGIGEKYRGTVLDENGALVLQAILASGSKENWQASPQGLSSRDLAMNIALPEVDGRVMTRAIAFKNVDNYDARVEANIVCHKADDSQVEFVVDLVKNWAQLRIKRKADRKVAIVLANYPNRDGRLGNGVGLDTPAGTLNTMDAMRAHGYHLADYPDTGDALINYLSEGPTNAASDGREIREVLLLNDYNKFFDLLPVKNQDEVTAKWGKPNDDPFFIQERNEFALPLAKFGNVVIGIQPARGYNIDPKETYHSPDLVPPHGYLAFYCWLRNQFGVDAIIHMGKHGNLEWLPGKALSLSETCYPEIAMGAVPHLYPFIVNDPGEGTQAKRRNNAVIIDHLTPPLTRAETYGPLRDLEALVDEYYEAMGNDLRRSRLLKDQILDLVGDIDLGIDAGIDDDDNENDKLEKLDGYLCELKEMQIRDGLHIFGTSPEGQLRDDLVSALVRIPRGSGEGESQSLQRAIADDLGMDFDPLDCDMAASFNGKCAKILVEVNSDPWRSNGDSVERIEMLATMFIRGEVLVPDSMARTAKVMNYVRNRVIRDVDACGPSETSGLLRGLDGQFVAPGPSGAPSRGRNDVLPTGRNFYSVDTRSVPTPTAWELGRKSAELLITRYRQDHGDWPKSFGLSVWGTSNMRTGGDDIAQAMALIGAKPIWEHTSRRVTGYEIIPVSILGRPRVDVTLRISGFFRDAFPGQIELFDKAIRAIGNLEETCEDNPIGARMMSAHDEMIENGMDTKEAERRKGFRIFGSKPGAYGAGLQALIDEQGWSKRDELAEAYLTWGSYAYGEKEAGQAEREIFSSRLSEMEAVIHNQDNREHDLLDSDDYYQFEGGMSAAVEQIKGQAPKIYHNDHSNPQKPVIRALEEEIARVVRARVVNPKWIAGVMRHDYKGAFEMAATTDYLFAFSATTNAVANHHFDLVYNAYLDRGEVQAFLADKNPAALKEIAARFLEAIERGMWTPRSNSAKLELEALIKGKAEDGQEI